jgi:antitoxin VapB
MEATMQTAKLFLNGRSQAIRLPKAFRFKGAEVYIKKVSDGVLLMPKDKTVWDVWEKNLNKYDTPFMVERNQPAFQQERGGFDEIFD